MSVSVLVKSFENKIKLIEQAIVNAATQAQQWADNHKGLTGMLQATKEALDEAKNVVNAVAPSSSAANALNTAENVVNVVDEVVGGPDASSEITNSPEATN